MGRRNSDLRSRLETAWSWSALVLATGFGVGFSPVMPGTVASLLGPPFVWALEQARLHAAVYGVIAAAVLLAGIPICSRATKTLGHHDPGQVVYDEIAAFTIVFAFVPLTMTTAVLGFVWFRIWDITKPWPIRRLERLPRGWGIMIDDMVAGVYAAVTLWLTVRVLGML